MTSITRLTEEGRQQSILKSILKLIV